MLFEFNYLSLKNNHQTRSFNTDYFEKKNFFSQRIYRNAGDMYKKYKCIQ